MLAIDLGVFHRSAHEVTLKEAAIWSAVWVALALGFNYGLYRFMGEQAGLEFLAGYLIEKVLSVDNIFILGKTQQRYVKFRGASQTSAGPLDHCTVTQTFVCETLGKCRVSRHF